VVRDGDIQNIIKTEHEKAGHAKIKKTYHNIQMSYTHIRRDHVEAYVQRCGVCSIIAYDTNKKKRHVNRCIRSAGPMQHFTFDLICKLSNPGGPNKEYHWIFHGIYIICMVTI
jgi:hypothetical protein